MPSSSCTSEACLSLATPTGERRLKRVHRICVGKPAVWAITFALMSFLCWGNYLQHGRLLDHDHLLDKGLVSTSGFFDAVRLIIEEL